MYVLLRLEASWAQICEYEETDRPSRRTQRYRYELQCSTKFNIQASKQALALYEPSWAPITRFPGSFIDWISVPL